MPLSIMMFYYISLGANILAFLLMLVVSFLPKGKTIKNEVEKKLFSALVISTMLGGLFGMFSYSTIILRMTFGQASWYGTARDICLIAMVVVLYHFVFQWMVYVDFRLYQSRDQLYRRYRILYVPVLIFLTGRLLAEFAGSVLPLPLEEVFQVELLFYIDDIFGFLFIICSAILAFQYKASKGYRSLFSILPGVIPMLIGYIVNWFTGYSTIAIGDAVGVVFVYIVLVRQQRFYEEEGFYSREYLYRIIKGDASGTERIRGAILFEVSQEADAFGRVLREEVEKDDLLIRDRKESFVLLTGAGGMEELKFLADMIESAAEEDANGVSYETRFVTRKRGEDAKEFIKRAALKEKEYYGRFSSR